MLKEHQLQIRVRYQETDAQTRVHHANYITYFEVARTEMLRASGYSYREMEDEGVFLVVSEINVRYLLPAQFDDELTIQTTVAKAKGARITFEYRIQRHEELLATGETVLACVSREGKPMRLPRHFRFD